MTCRMSPRADWTGARAPQKAEEKAGWSKPLGKGGTGERLAAAASPCTRNTFVAQMAEITMKRDGSFRVDRIVCAVDWCGRQSRRDSHADGRRHRVWPVPAALRGAAPSTGYLQLQRKPDYDVSRMRVVAFLQNVEERRSDLGAPGIGLQVIVSASRR